jgi:hypothetical protein
MTEADELERWVNGTFIALTLALAILAVFAVVFWVWPV